MAEVQTRGGGARGRGGSRGGRGGFRGSRNPNRTHQRADNESENIPSAALADQGEVGELKKKFGDKVPLLREICPGWSDEDLVYALQETDGDVNAAADRISSGTIAQWGEVKKKHPKSKEAPPAPSDSGPTRGRGRGNFEGRGRGRGTDRGGRGGRGAKAAPHANGTKATKSADDGWGDGTSQAHAETGTGWDTAPTNGDAATAGDWGNEFRKDALSSPTPDEPKPAAAAALPAAKPGGWAGLFAKPPPAPKRAPAPVPGAPSEDVPPVSTPAFEEPTSTEPIIMPHPIEAVHVEDLPSELPSAHADTGKDLTPSKDALTEKNLEQLPDHSHPHPSATAAGTLASTPDALAPGESTKPTIRPGMSGYAASAFKATAVAGRSASHARKVMEQQEAVVMPGNHAIEKAAVQFGKMGLNGSDDVDVDEDREEPPETRPQLPDDSPAAPRASLPPSMPEAQATAQAPTAPSVDGSQGPRQAPGLPPAPQQPPQPSPPTGSTYADQYRYGQGQKVYDPFGQPSQQPQPQPQTQSQEPFSNQVPNQSLPASAAAQNDYSSYYGRDVYQNYYGAYGQGQDAQRTGSTFGSTAQETPGQYATSRPQPGYGQQDAQGSGHNTPAPALPGHQAQHSQHLHSQGGHGGYPYGYYNQQYPQYGASYMSQMGQRYGASRPMFDDVRRQDSDFYGNQYAYGHNQQYGSTYKSTMYGQPQQQYPYEHSSSPANVGAFGGRDGAYGRAGSTQPSESQQTAATSTAFSGVPDPFGRTSSGFGQNQGISQQHGGHPGGDDPAKASGPSPSVQAGRPGSTVNAGPSQQGGLPPPQSQHSGQQAAFGGYPQYGGLGNLGGHQSTHQNTAYGGYASNAAGFGTYGAYGGGRGWNGSYGTGH